MFRTRSARSPGSEVQRSAAARGLLKYWRDRLLKRAARQVRAGARLQSESDRKLGSFLLARLIERAPHPVFARACGRNPHWNWVRFYYSEASLPLVNRSTGPPPNWVRSYQREWCGRFAWPPDGFQNILLLFANAARRLSGAFPKAPGALRQKAGAQQ